MTEFVLRTTELTKIYKHDVALDKVTLRVKKGTIMGLSDKTAQANPP